MAISDFLKTARTAHFFRIKTGFSAADTIEKARVELGATHAQQPVLNDAVAVAGGTAAASLAVFLVTGEPGFLDGSTVKEHRGAFMMTVEFDGYLAVFRRGIGALEAALPVDELEAIPYAVLTRIYCTNTVAVERLRLNAMSLSSYTIRRRTLEADDLTGSLSPLQSGRAIPSAMTFRQGTRGFSVLPGTSRFAEQHAPSTFVELAEWAAGVINEITADHGVSQFLDRFPTPIALCDLPNNVQPTSVLLDLGSLQKGLADGTLEVVVDDPGGGPVLPADHAALDLTILRGRFFLFDLVPDAAGKLWFGGVDRAFGAHVKKNKNSFTVGAHPLAFLQVRDVTSGKCRSMTAFLSDEQDFTVAFDDPAYIYHGRGLFRDDGLFANPAGLISVLDPLAALQHCTSEKGSLGKAGKRFPPTSVFGVVESKLSTGADFVLLDDLGDEWADHIAVTASATSRRIEFIHSKHGDVSLSATAFHDVVGQALKNLGRLFPRDAEIQAKLPSWRAAWNLNKASLPRIRRGATADAAAVALRAVAADPAATRAVTICVSFLSKSALEAQIQSIQAGAAAPAHVVQLVWILAAFVDAVREAGAIPRVVCQP